MARLNRRATPLSFAKMAQRHNDGRKTQMATRGQWRRSERSADDRAGHSAMPSDREQLARELKWQKRRRRRGVACLVLVAIPLMNAMFVCTLIYGVLFYLSNLAILDWAALILFLVGMAASAYWAIMLLRYVDASLRVTELLEEQDGYLLAQSVDRHAAATPPAAQTIQ